MCGSPWVFDALLGLARCADADSLRLKRAASVEWVGDRVWLNKAKPTCHANKKAPPKAGLEPERFWESVLVSTPEVVFRTPHTHRPYDGRKMPGKRSAVAA